MKDLLKTLDGLDEKYQLVAKSDAQIPSRLEVVAIIKDLQYIMFPAFFKNAKSLPREQALIAVQKRMAKQICVAQKFVGGSADNAKEIAKSLIQHLPEIKEKLLKDVQALYEGDPASKFRDEVLICYPGFYAISIYRLAHFLHSQQVPLLPRMMTEFAHEKTGIDIHPGAKIGEYFFIDHGTGIVVGETTTIGDHVKLYQGVTLGAKSFELDENGNPVKNIKRHPDIDDNTIIYANATILGGNTHVGKNCVIGGNTWLVHSVQDGQTIYYGK